MTITWARIPEREHAIMHLIAYQEDGGQNLTYFELVSSGIISEIKCNVEIDSAHKTVRMGSISNKRYQNFQQFIRFFNYCYLLCKSTTE